MPGVLKHVSMGSLDVYCMSGKLSRHLSSVWTCQYTTPWWISRQASGCPLSFQISVWHPDGCSKMSRCLLSVQTCVWNFKWMTRCLAVFGHLVLVQIIYIYILLITMFLNAKLPASCLPCSLLFSMLIFPQIQHYCNYYLRPNNFRSHGPIFDDMWWQSDEIFVIHNPFKSITWYFLSRPLDQFLHDPQILPSFKTKFPPPTWCFHCTLYNFWWHVTTKVTVKSCDDTNIIITKLHWKYVKFKKFDQ